MKKIFLFLSLIISISLLFIGFTKHDNFEKNTFKIEKTKLYALAFDSAWEMDKGLNSDIKYVSINTKTFKDFSEEDKGKLFDYIADKYNVTMLDMNIDELKDEGYVKDLSFKDGILFQVDKYNSYSSNSVSFEGTKWCSGVGAIGFSFKGKMKNNKWKLVECNMTWIA